MKVGGNVAPLEGVPTVITSAISLQPGFFAGIFLVKTVARLYKDRACFVICVALF